MSEQVLSNFRQWSAKEDHKQLGILASVLMIIIPIIPELLLLYWFFTKQADIVPTIAGSKTGYFILFMVGKYFIWYFAFPLLVAIFYNISIV